MKALFLAFVLLVFSSFIAGPAHSKFAPDNNEYIGVDEKTTSTIDEIEFNLIADTIANIYTQGIEALGAKITFEKKWEDGTVNAYASQAGTEWKIALFGGLARYPGMTSDAFALVICHEVGHHIGGQPRYLTWYGTEQWASCEGQSDYFAGAKCFKRYLDKRYEDEGTEIGDVKLDDFIPIELRWKSLTTCAQEYENDSDAMFRCAKTLDAGVAFGSVLATLAGKFPTSLETPDTTVVSKTNRTGYPSPQCRTDTVVNGAFCKENPVSEFFCELGVGARPRCWYKPKQ